MHFKEYKDHKHGSMAPIPHFAAYDKEHDLGTMGMVLDTVHGVSVETRTDAINADLDDDEGESDDESDDDDDEEGSV